MLALAKGTASRRALAIRQFVGMTLNNCSSRDNLGQGTRQLISTTRRGHRSQFLTRFEGHGKAVALTDGESRNWTYEELNWESDRVARALDRKLLLAPEEPSAGKRRGRRPKQVAFLCENDSSYLKALLGIWKSGHVAVPLAKSHPTSVLDYYVNDSGSEVVVCTAQLKDKVLALSAGSSTILVLDELEGVAHPESTPSGSDLLTTATTVVDQTDDDDDDPAIIIYTSGTTGPPKGVVHTHRSLWNQVESMETSWRWTGEDCILHVLPLNHVHGLVNCLLCPLAVGARVLMHPGFDPARVWSTLLDRDNGVNVFMAVPTVYSKLLSSRAGDDDDDKSGPLRSSSAVLLADKFRLMVSGSAALPEPLLRRWQSVSGHVLLERYGMTEVGMALTNPYAPTSARRPGFVGRPFPSVQVRIVSPDRPEEVLVEDHGDDRQVVPPPPSAGKRTPEVLGDLQVRGPSLFKGYHNRPEETTSKEFTADGWFRTGDTAGYVDGAFRIAGRTSVDVIKAGGYKISALDVERVLLEHPAIVDVAVLGVPDDTYGQRVAALVVLATDDHQQQASLDLDGLRQWALPRLPPYQVPTLFRAVDHLPRNAMGKVNKKDLLGQVVFQ